MIIIVHSIDDTDRIAMSKRKAMHAHFVPYHYSTFQMCCIIQREDIPVTGCLYPNN